MLGSNVDETSEQTRGREIEPTARGMEKGLKDLREHIQDLRDRVLGSQVQPVSHEGFMSFQDKVMSMFSSMKSMVEALATCMEARDQEAPRVEVPKPHTFNDKRDAKELDNFLWHMERYFEAITLTDEDIKVYTATIYLTNNATLWWHWRFADIENETCTINTWDAFNQEIKSNSTLKIQEITGDTPKEGSSKAPSGKDDKCKDKRKEFTPRTNYFLCDGPHWVQNYPKKKALNAMIKENEKEGDAHVGSL
ncbi:hypothetical protein CK203_046406 [Vitis vinifera]|uniref:Retrotransposon gag domain-containing protein n=1 Tax=Vitis vinifera TaxID=29760 RepID=A0A438I1Z8_VITVI|nr:hypothetical protein CK203_046406 [Vitis vinifera]